MVTKRSASVWLLAFALVAAQMLGLLHRVVHLHAPAASSSASFAASQVAVQAPQQAHAWAQDLFSGHDGDPGCRLFDLCGAGAPLPDAPTLPAMAVPAFFLVWSAGEFVARWATLFDARGPPALR